MNGRICRLLMPVLMGLILVPGCAREYPEDLEYQFSLHAGLGLRPEETVPPEKIATVAQRLKPYFGSPRKPKVTINPDPDGILTDPEMQLQQDRIQKGSVIYRELCLTCHGLSGDGSGPTGQSLNPRPRDFRQKWFKFKTTVDQKRAPARDDLKRTIRNGIPGASMPAHILGEDNADALVSYIIHLSLRGRVEAEMVSQMMAGESRPDVRSIISDEAKSWLGEAKNRLEPPPPTGGWDKFFAQEKGAIVAEGRKMFLGAGACKDCHGKDGRASIYDADLQQNLNRLDDWGRPIIPRNLALGVFRGGAGPREIWYRIKYGISGTGMSAASTDFKDEQLWYLVYYVLDLSNQK